MDMTHTHLARMTGYTRPYISRVMRGLKTPSALAIARISHVMGITADELLERLGIAAHKRTSARTHKRTAPPDALTHKRTDAANVDAQDGRRTSGPAGPSSCAEENATHQRPDAQTHERTRTRDR